MIVNVERINETLVSAPVVFAFGNAHAGQVPKLRVSLLTRSHTSRNIADSR